MTRDGSEAVDEDDDDDGAPEVGDFLRRAARAVPREPPGSPASDPIPGTVLDARYRIDAFLGRGGMGTVYAATHLGTGRAVALKVMRPQLTADEAAVDRFAREARAAGQIRHSNVVDVTDFGFAEQGLGGAKLAYLVMERLQGETLRALLDDKGRLPLDVAVDLLTQIGAGVGEAHRVGVLHRDLKPENIHLEPGPRGRYQVKVLDFGIAKLVAEVSGARAPGPSKTTAARASVITASGLATTSSLEDPVLDRAWPAGSDRGPFAAPSGVVGTPRYMSPEQWLGNASDARTDIYSLGVMAYEMLAGEPPFQGRERSIRIEHAENTPPSLARVAPGIPPGIARVIEAALAKDPAARPPSAAAFVAGLSVGTETTARLLRRSLVLCVDHFVLFSRRCAPVTVPLVVLAFVPVVTSWLAAGGTLSHHADRTIDAIVQGVTLLSIVLWTPVTGSLVPLVASLVAGRETIPAPPTAAELWRDLRRAAPSSIACMAVLVGVTFTLIMATRTLARIAGLPAESTPATIGFTFLACVVVSAATALFAVIGPVAVVEGAHGFAPLRRSMILIRPVFRAAFGVTVLGQMLSQALPALAVLALGAIAPDLSRALLPLDVERLRELIGLIVAMAFTPFSVVPSALLYLRARDAEGCPLTS